MHCKAETTDVIVETCIIVKIPQPQGPNSNGRH